MASSMVARPAATARTRAAERRHGALGFTTALLCATLLLQRFGLPLGGKAFSIVGPIGLALAALGVARGALAFDRFRLAAYLAFALCAVLGIAWHAIQPASVLTAFTGAVNIDSLAQFLLLTAFATLAFAEPVEEGRFFREVNRWFAIVAAAGVLQFFAQLVGVRVFAFTGILPDFMLFESGFNLQIGLGAADLLKSNGFFLVEPSTFSQVMALALIIEILAFRRIRHLALFAAGMLLSFSGTGWVVLASFVAAAALGMGGRGIAIAVATVVVLALLLAVLAWLAPDIAGALQGRFGEISTPSTSGHQRFITPFWVLHDVLQEAPSALLLGIGSGVSERLNLSYLYDVNTPIKVLLEYGLPALVCYLALFLGARRTPVQSALVVPALVMFLVAGAYQQFPPVLFLVLLLIAIARLTPTGTLLSAPLLAVPASRSAAAAR